MLFIDEFNTKKQLQRKNQNSGSVKQRIDWSNQKASSSQFKTKTELCQYRRSHCCSLYQRLNENSLRCDLLSWTMRVTWEENSSASKYAWISINMRRKEIVQRSGEGPFTSAVKTWFRIFLLRLTIWRQLFLIETSIYSRLILLQQLELNSFITNKATQTVNSEFLVYLTSYV